MRWRFAVPVLLVMVAPTSGRAWCGEKTAVEAGRNGSDAVDGESPGEEEQPDERWWQRPKFLGDLGGARANWQDAGWTFNLFYNSFLGIQGSGGKEQGSQARPSGSVDFFVQTDFEKMGWIPGGEILMQVKNNHGKNINPPVGALSDPIDDADFTEPIYLDQLWYQQTFAGRKAQLRLGYLDLQTIIDRNVFANSEDVQLMATFLDNNNAIVPLKIGLGVTLFAYPTSWLALTLGLVDADNQILHAGWETAFDGFDSLMVFLETGFKPRLSSRRGPLQGNYRAGLLWDPRDKNVFETGELRTESRDTGVYVSFDQVLLPEIPNSLQGLGAFFRWGHRTRDVNRLSDFWSAGLQYRGLVRNRDNDLFGFGFYSARGSKDYREYVNPLFDHETGWEWYYSFQVTPWLTVTPDFQYIEDPGATALAGDGVVFAFRTRFTF